MSNLRILFVFLLFLQFTAMSDDVAAQGEAVRVGLYQNSPKIFMDETGAAKGFFPQIINLLTKSFGWQVTYIPCEWATCLKKLEVGEIDIMPDVAFSEERSKRFKYGHEAVLHNGSYIYFLPGKTLNDFEKLAGHKVAVLKDSIQEKYLLTLLPKLGEKHLIVETQSLRNVLEAVQSGKAEFGIVNNFFGERHEGEFNLDRSLTLFQPFPLYFAYSKLFNEDTIHRIDTAIGMLKEKQGTGYDKAINTWLKPTVGFNVPVWMAWTIGSIAGGLLFGILLWRYIGIIRLNRTLKESEELQRTTLNSIGDAVISTDASGAITRINPIAENLTGWNAIDAIGKPLIDIFKIISAKTREPSINPVKEVLEVGKIVGLANHTILISKDGTEFQIADSAAPIWDDNNQLMGVVLVFRDVTEEYATREELRTREVLFQNLAAQVPGVIYQFLLRPDGSSCFPFSSKGIVDIYGVTPEQVKENADPVFSVLHPDDIETVSDKIQESAETLMPWRDEYRVILPGENEPSWREGFAKPERLDDGSTLWHGFITNIDQRKQQQQELQESEARFDRAMKGTRDGLWDWHVVTDEEYFSPQWMAMLGYEQGDVENTGTAFFSLVHEEDHRSAREAIRAHFEDDDIFDMEIRLLCKDGTYKWFRTRGEATRDEDGQPLRMAGSITDIMDQKIAEENLIKAKAEAEAANKSKSEFLASMSHELRTPLNAVLGFSQMLQLDLDAPLSPKQSDYVDNVIEGGKHLLDLVSEILDLASIEADHVSISLAKVNVSEVADRCLSLMQPLAKPKGIEFINKLADKPWPDMRTDPTRLKQVLINLLSNAIKYNKDGGTVTLDGLETKGGYLHISVADTGHGIATEDFHGVFQIFNRLGIDPMIASEGTGIGLSVTKMLVERLSGRVGFDSEVGIGSIFWIELPLASNEDVLIWADQLRVGVDAIDADHQKLISLTNKLPYGAVDESNLTEIVGELINYALYHFKREEAVMAVCGYPDLEKHRNLHNNLATQMNKFADEWRQSYNIEMLIKLRRFMQNWLTNHVMKVDKEIAQYTNGKGQDINLALETIEGQKSYVAVAKHIDLS